MTCPSLGPRWKVVVSSTRVTLIAIIGFGVKLVSFYLFDLDPSLHVVDDLLVSPLMWGCSLRLAT